MNPDQSNNTEGPGRPQITVVTVTYNAASTLEITLRSVAEQDYRQIEHLIVDGCSKDSTLSIIRLYMERNTKEQHPHHIRLLSEPDEGLYDAMNKAIDQAHGEYMVFLNAGDSLHTSHTISHIAECIGKNTKPDGKRPAIIYGETDLVDENRHFIRHRRLTTPRRLSWRSFLTGMRVCHQSFYIRTDLAQVQHYDLKYRFSADFDWCIKLLKTAAKRRLPIVNAHQILTDYLAEGMTTRNHQKSLHERFFIMTKHYGWLITILMHGWFAARSVIKK